MDDPRLAAAYRYLVLIQAMDEKEILAGEGTLLRQKIASRSLFQESELESGLRLKPALKLTDDLDEVMYWNQFRIV